MAKKAIFETPIAEKKRKEKLNKEWFSSRSIWGNDWAIFYLFLGGREAGKSYDITNMFVRQWKQKGRPFYWLRLTETSMEKLLKNNAEKLVDPDIRRKYNLDLKVIGNDVYEITKRNKDRSIKEKKKMATVLCLSTFYNDKGSTLFDKDFLNDPKMYYNICLDEMNREQNEKKTFDIVYAFTNQLENLVRSTKQRVRVCCIGNTLEEASDILCAFEFIPSEYGRYYLKKKRAVIDYIEPSEKYLARRKGTIADILSPTASTFTNKIETDKTLLYTGRLGKPTRIIKFSKNIKFTLWDGKVISEFNHENVPVTAMRPYLDDVFNAEARDNIILTFDNRGYQYKNLISFKRFQKELELLKPRK